MFQNIVNTLVLNLNRPGWAITCIEFDEFGLDGVVSVSSRNRGLVSIL